MRGPDFSKFDPQNSPPNVSIASGCIITIAISISAAFITLGARLYCRLVRTKKPGWDDATIVLATVSHQLTHYLSLHSQLQICIFIETIFKCIFIYHGQGRHVFYLDAHQIQEAYKYSQLAFFPFLFGTAIAKISIAFMVLRFTPAKGMRYFMYGLMASLVVSNGACVVILFSFCRPYYSLWDCKVKNAVCWSGRVLGIASSIQGGESTSANRWQIVFAWRATSLTFPVFSINTDLICTSLPLFIVWKLHMGLDQKLAVTILIDFGLITTGFCIARCIYYSKTKFAADQTCQSPNAKPPSPYTLKIITQTLTLARDRRRPRPLDVPRKQLWHIRRQFTCTRVCPGFEEDYS